MSCVSDACRSLADSKDAATDAGEEQDGSGSWK